jgi:hypothetical protein
VKCLQCGLAGMVAADAGRICRKRVTPKRGGGELGLLKLSLN